MFEFYSSHWVLLHFWIELNRRFFFNQNNKNLDFGVCFRRFLFQILLLVWCRVLLDSVWLYSPLRMILEQLDVSKHWMNFFRLMSKIKMTGYPLVTSIMEVGMYKVHINKYK